MAILKASSVPQSSSSKRKTMKSRVPASMQDKSQSVGTSHKSKFPLKEAAQSPSTAVAAVEKRVMGGAEKKAFHSASAHLLHRRKSIQHASPDDDLLAVNIPGRRASLQELDKVSKVKDCESSSTVVVKHLLHSPSPAKSTVGVDNVPRSSECTASVPTTQAVPESNHDKETDLQSKDLASDSTNADTGVLDSHRSAKPTAGIGNLPTSTVPTDLAVPASSQGRENVPQSQVQAGVGSNYALIPSHLPLATTMDLHTSTPPSYTLQEATYVTQDYATPRAPLKDLTNYRERSLLTAGAQGDHASRAFINPANVQPLFEEGVANHQWKYGNPPPTAAEQGKSQGDIVHPIPMWPHQQQTDQCRPDQVQMWPFNLADSQAGGIGTPELDGFGNPLGSISLPRNSSQNENATTATPACGEFQVMTPRLQDVLQALVHIKESIVQLQHSVNEIKGNHQLFQADLRTNDVSEGNVVARAEKEPVRHVVVSSLPPLEDPQPGEVEFSHSNFMMGIKYKYMNGRLTFICCVLFGRSSLHKYYTAHRNNAIIVLEPSILVGIYLLVGRMTRYRNALTARSNNSPEEIWSLRKVTDGLSKIFSRCRRLGPNHPSNRDLIEDIPGLECEVNSNEENVDDDSLAEEGVDNVN